MSWNLSQNTLIYEGAAAAIGYGVGRIGWGASAGPVGAAIAASPVGAGIGWLVARTAQGVIAGGAIGAGLALLSAVYFDTRYGAGQPY